MTPDQFEQGQILSASQRSAKYRSQLSQLSRNPQLKSNHGPLCDIADRDARMKELEDSNYGRYQVSRTISRCPYGASDAIPELMLRKVLLNHRERRLARVQQTSHRLLRAGDASEMIRAADADQAPNVRGDLLVR